MIYHRAYTFDPEMFHSELRETCIDKDGLNLQKLYEEARRTVYESLHNKTAILRDIRYGDEWLDSDENGNEPDYWYVILLADRFEPIQNLPIPSHTVFRRVLPLIGWSDREITTFLLGKNLALLPQKHGNRDFENIFTDLKQFGGWLELAELIGYRDRLIESEQSITSFEEQAHVAIQDYADERGEEPAELLRSSFNGAFKMLNKCIGEKYPAIFISFD